MKLVLVRNLLAIMARPEHVRRRVRDASIIVKNWNKPTRTTVYELGKAHACDWAEDLIQSWRMFWRRSVPARKKRRAMRGYISRSRRRA